MSKIFVRKTSLCDILSIVHLSRLRMDSDEKSQPKFLKIAENANETMQQSYMKLLNNKNYLMFIAQQGKNIIGYIIALVTKAKRIYDPEGLNLIVDEFYVQSPDLWDVAGNKLLQAAILKGKTQGAKNILILTNNYDKEKLSFMGEQDLETLSSWRYKEI